MEENQCIMKRVMMKKKIILTMRNDRIEREERRKLERKGLWTPDEIKQKIRPRIGDRLVELMLEDDLI